MNGDWLETGPPDRFAIRADQPIEPSALVTAVHAVIGETSAFNHLRAGRVVDVPAGGGLDILSAITISVPASPPGAPSPQSTSAPVPESPNAESAAQTSARAAREARAKLDGAKQALSKAQAEAQARRADVERSQSDEGSRIQFL